ncbi:hypothetical protein GCM10025734_05220 [Kitasatospora paranensis]
MGSYVEHDLTTLADILESAARSLPPDLHPRARRTVAAFARDRDDYRMLLDALGLVPDDSAVPGAAGRGPDQERAAPSVPGARRAGRADRTWDDGRHGHPAQEQRDRHGKPARAGGGARPRVRL